MKEKVSNVNALLDQCIFKALETYSNVHRGSGQFSLVTTRLYERAREVVLEFLGLDKKKYTVIFCSPRIAEKLISFLTVGTFREVTDLEAGLSLGVRAIAIQKSSLPTSIPFMTGGGTARLIAPGWVVQAKPPARFEPGTPAIISVIAFARALQLVRVYGSSTFRRTAEEHEKAAAIVYGEETGHDKGEVSLDQLKQQVLGTKVMVPAHDGILRYINLDYAASTPALVPAWEAWRRTYQLSCPVRDGIPGEVRSVISGFLNAPLSEYDVIFTRNTTEAINLMAESLFKEIIPGIEAVILNTLSEHNSNELPWRDIPGIKMERVAVNKEGYFDFTRMERLLREYNQEQLHGRKRISMVTVTGASNVLSTFNNLAETAVLAHQYDSRLLVDAAQLVAHRKVDMEKEGIDGLVFSGHKIYAPFGTGVLVIRKGMLRFSRQEMEIIQSSGEENSAGIAALGRAIVSLQRTGMELIIREEQELTARLLKGISGIPGVTVYGISDPESPSFRQKGGVISFSIEGMMPERIAEELASEGIGIRCGCHCAHLMVKHMLNVPLWAQKLQRVVVTLFPKMELPGVARISFGMGTTPEDIDEFLLALTKIARKDKSQNQFSASASRPSKKLLKLKMDEFARTVENEIFGSSLQH